MIKFVFCLRYGLGRILFEETSNFDFFLFFLFFFHSGGDLARDW